MCTLLKTTSLLRKIVNNRICLTQSHRKMSKFPKRIFSGIQPTGDVHLGNYLGAIKTWIRLQEENESCIWSIVDMHAITLPQDPQTLNSNILKMTATLLACGIDPKKSILYQQSSVPMHAEFAWILGCITTMARLARLPQYKEKSEKVKNVTLGIYIYPVLQAADILLYKATHVPCGQDQIQHIELAKELATSFNKKFGNILCPPNAIISADASQRIKALNEPSKKMSKSAESPKGCVYLFDEPDVIFQRIKKAVTDFCGKVTYEPEARPGVSNLVGIHSILTGKSTDQVCSEVTHLDTGEYKLLLADVVIETLAPIRQEYLKLIGEPLYLNEVLKDGKERALEIAEKNLYEIQEKVGFNLEFQCRKQRTVKNI